MNSNGHENKAGAGNAKAVQERLLEAAEELFSERGFDGTTVRELAAAANCNVAAVNYYFGGKDKLYEAVWRRQLQRIRDRRIASVEAVMEQRDVEPSLEGLIRSYANAFLEPLADEQKGCRHLQLMAREMVERRLPRSLFIEEMVIPVMRVLEKAFCRLYPGLGQKDAQLVILSIVGQLVHMVMVRAMFEERGVAWLAGLDLGEVVEHIVRFSSAGVRACAEGSCK